jgi:hypothetical protein
MRPSLDVAWNRRILFQRQVRANLIVVFLIAAEQVTKILLAEDNDMIQAISADTDEPFGVSLIKSSQLPATGHA